MSTVIGGSHSCAFHFNVDYSEFCILSRGIIIMYCRDHRHYCKTVKTHTSGILTAVRKVYKNPHTILLSRCITHQ